MIGRIIEQALRRERAGILAGLLRLTGDFDLAEECLQVACVRAFETWPRQGMPDNAGAWLNTVARRQAIDAMRLSKRIRQSGQAWHQEEADQDLAPGTAAMAMENSESAAGVIAGAGGAAGDQEPGAEMNPQDERLRLLIFCCRPSLPERARAALALRSFLGLTTREIARAFLEPEATTAQRLVRAKRVLKQEQAARLFAEPPPLAEALPSVLTTLYLLFNEGYLAHEGGVLVRLHLCEDAIHLAALLTELCPGHAESLGLLALMRLHAARRAGRVSAAGEFIPLEEQDRSLWDKEEIAAGCRLLDEALALQAPGPYQIQAAIAALHAQARHAEDTDWNQIAALYGMLLRHQATPVIRLNAAVALGMAKGAETGLRSVNALEREGPMDGYHLLAAVKADFLRRLGHRSQANRYYRRARKLSKNAVERAYLDRRVAETDPPSA